MNDPGGRVGTLWRRWSGRAPLLLAGALVLVFWVLALGQAERSVFGRVPLLDEVYYLDRAAEITSGTSPAEPFFMSPLYPRLIAAVGAGRGVPADRVLTGSELRGLRLLQVACWLGVLALVRVLAGRFVPDDWTGRRRRAAVWLPVLLFALYRPAAVYSLAVLLEMPLTMLLLLGLVLVTGTGAAARRATTMLAAGVVFGLAGLLRGTVLLVVPVVVVGLLSAPPRDRRALRAVVLLLSGLLAVLLPPVVHNSRLAGRLVGPTLNGGVNLYIGNGPEANGFYVAAVPGDWRTDPAGRAFLAGRFGRDTLSLAEADRIWADEAWHTMRTDPLRTLKLILRKAWLQVQGWEIDQLTPLDGWARTVPVLQVQQVPYALLVVLAAAGLATGRRRRIWAGLVAVLAVLLAGQSLFFVVSRYRLVLVPLWCVPAGIGLVRLVERRRGAVLAGLLAAALTVPWGLDQIRVEWRGLAAANEALRWADLGRATGADADLARAEDLYRRSVAVVGTRPASWLGLAAVLRERGRPDDQAAALREGIARVPSPLLLQKALVAAELARGREPAALAAARAVLAEDPRDADTLHNIAVLLARGGDPQEALTFATTLREAHPDDPQGYLDLGVILARLGRTADARAALVDGLARFPDHAGLRHNLSRLSD